MNAPLRNGFSADFTVQSAHKHVGKVAIYIDEKVLASLLQHNLLHVVQFSCASKYSKSQVNAILLNNIS